jgi:transposase
MSAPLEIRRTDYSSAELRAWSGRCSDGAQVRRLLALALVLDGRSRTEAAALSGMDRQTLRDWVHRFNEQGPDGLKDVRHGGARERLSTEQKAELSQIVETGPDPAVDGVVRWRRIDLKRVIDAYANGSRD